MMEDVRIRRAAIAAAFLLALVVGLVLFAPHRVLTRIAEVQLEQALQQQYQVQIRQVTLRPPARLVVRDASIIRRPEADAAPDTPRPLPTNIDSVRARVGLFSLLRRQPRATVTIRMDDGEARLSLAPGDGGEGLYIQVTFDDLELRRIQPLRERLGLPIQGRVNGTVELAYDERMRLAGGEVDLEVSSTVLGPGEIHNEAFRPFGGFIPLPATRVGTIVLRTSIDGSDLGIDEFTATGADVRVEVGGEANLRDPLRASMVRLALTFSLSEEYVEEAGLGAALNLWPVLREAQTGDGYALLISGTLGNLGEPQPLRGRAR